MSLPGFTAEGSLGKTGRRYALSAGTKAPAANVRPQGFHVVPNGNDYDLIFCDPNAGCSVVWSTSQIRQLR
jgi:hypothetical protein